ncbi:MAG TPA: hypothetical protein VGP07_02850 [Polyangia bacterium]|jgi:hypothetical protein
MLARVGVACALLAGCGGGGGGGGTVSEQPLSGAIGGRPWAFVTGQSNPFLSDENHFWVDAYATTFATCTQSQPLNADELILNLPTKVGSYSLGLNLNVTFYDGTTNDNLVATSGTLTIDSVTTTMISGGLNAAYNAKTSVDGKFQATICAN